MGPRRSLLALVLLSAVLPIAVHSAHAWTAGAPVDLGTALSPSAALSSSGDFATDTFNDPWDFSNPEDVIPVNGVGTGSAEVSVGGGQLTVATRNASQIRLLMKWPEVLPWGRDGWANPIDAARYTQTTMSIYSDVTLSMAIRFQTSTGQWGVIPFVLPAGWSTQHFDLLNRALYPFAGSDAQWSGSIVWFELFRGGAIGNPGDPVVNVKLDWVRLHRADASQTPPAGLPLPVVISPNIEGGADYATTVRGNPWDFAGLDDVGETHDVAYLSTASGDLTGITVNNDPFIGLPLGPALNTDRFHRLTVDVCYDGPFSLNDAAGGGMLGRVAWMPSNPGGVWTESQDIIVFPGCHRMTLDMATSGPASLNDESSGLVTGWRGMRPTALRFDLNEDRGVRGFTLREVRLADDAAFSSSYPITFVDAAGASGVTADIFVSAAKGSYNGTRIARNVAVTGGINTFDWDGRDDLGQPMANGNYWVYIVMHNSVGKGAAYASGPLREEKPVPSTPSYFVPLTPARLLDTRTGEGGNIVPLGPGVFTELNVAGVGGVPATGVTAVVMNVTVTGPSAPGFITVWPSGDVQPGVSNLNFVPGQTVPNLVTVKVGANGKVNLLNSSGYTDVIVDVAGYYTTTAPPSGGRFTAVTPARLLDTRDGTGTGGVIAPIPSGQSINLTVTGHGGVPASGVSGVALNVTVDQPTGNGYLTVWPTGERRPTASTHNFVPGLTVANMVIAKVGSNGQVSVFNSMGSTHVVADVIGYFSSTGGAFVPVTPQRLIDTRFGIGVPAGAIGQGATLGLPIGTNTPVPVNATAVIVNVTSVNSTLPSFVTVWPSGALIPRASTMNPRPGVPVPNQAYLRLGPDGALQAFNNAGSTDLIVDVFGYVM